MEYEDICRYIFAREGLNFDEQRYSDSREKTIKTARHISMYFARELYPKMSWRQIAETFNRDHSTAIYAHKIVRNDYETDKAFRYKIDDIERALTGDGSHDLTKLLKIIRIASVKRKLLADIDKLEAIVRVYDELTGRNRTRMLARKRLKYRRK